MGDDEVVEDDDIRIVVAEVVVFEFVIDEANESDDDKRQTNKINDNSTDTILQQENIVLQILEREREFLRKFKIKIQDKERGR